MDELLTKEAKEWIGYEYPIQTFEVTKHDILKFAYATGERNALHLDEAVSLKRGYRGLVAPPMFYIAVRTAAYHIVPLEEFSVDGTPKNDLPPISTIRGMGGEISAALPTPICAGDTLTIGKRVDDVWEKQGRSGPLVFVKFAFTITNQLSETVLNEEFTRIFR
ncbi:MAG: MaoC family dehydratase N-terminal domain-containing protein [Acidimicrobiia bacterium]